MTMVRRPQGGNTGAGPDIEGQGTMRSKTKKKSPVRKVGKGGKRGY